MNSVDSVNIPQVEQLHKFSQEDKKIVNRFIGLSVVHGIFMGVMFLFSIPSFPILSIGLYLVLWFLTRLFLKKYLTKMCAVIGSWKLYKELQPLYLYITTFFAFGIFTVAHHLGIYLLTLLTILVFYLVLVVYGVLISLQILQLRDLLKNPK